jgi:hypothetical protein
LLALTGLGAHCQEEQVAGVPVAEGPAPVPAPSQDPYVAWLENVADRIRTRWEDPAYPLWDYPCENRKTVRFGVVPSLPTDDPSVRTERERRAAEPAAHVLRQIAADLTRTITQLRWKHASKDGVGLTEYAAEATDPHSAALLRGAYEKYRGYCRRLGDATDRPGVPACDVSWDIAAAIPQYLIEIRYVDDQRSIALTWLPFPSEWSCAAHPPRLERLPLTGGVVAETPAVLGELARFPTIQLPTELQSRLARADVAPQPPLAGHPPAVTPRVLPPARHAAVATIALHRAEDSPARAAEDLSLSITGADILWLWPPDVQEGACQYGDPVRVRKGDAGPVLRRYQTRTPCCYGLSGARDSGRPDCGSCDKWEDLPQDPNNRAGRIVDIPESGATTCFWLPPVARWDSDETASAGDPQGRTR